MLEHATAIKNIATTVEALAAARVAESNAWKAAGERSAAHHLAKTTGVGVGTAAAALETAKRLNDLPATAGAARAGTLSPQQAAMIADAAKANPGAETKLLEGAKTQSLSELRDECAKAKAAVADLDERRRRIHERRQLRTYVDSDGAWNLRMRDNPEVGAEIMAAIEPIRDELFRRARAEGRREPGEAYGADALAELARRGSAGTASGKRFANAKILARIDLDALVRGHAEGGETCELVGYGPVPVSVITEMIDSGNPFLVAIATKGIDVVGVAHLGRRFTAAQVSAMEFRDPTCAAEGCNQVARLELDHRDDWAKTKKTRFTSGDRLCGHDHDKKTRLGWALVEGSGKRPFVPPDDPRHPRNTGRAPPVEADEAA